MSKENHPEKIAFLVDSCADLSAKQLKGKPIYVAPLRIEVDGKEYHDGVDIDNEGVYRLQKKGKLPKTSLPDMTKISELLDKIHKDGGTRVLAFPLSAGLSGTHNLVRLLCSARKDLEVEVFDTRTASLGISMVVLQLWEELQAGLTWDQAKARAAFLLKNTTPYFSADTLEYLQKGGRIGKVAAMAGTLLNIKPIIGFTGEGELTDVAKARGKRQVYEQFLKLLRGHYAAGKRFNLAVANGGDPEGMALLRKEMEAAFPGYGQFWETRMDATLAAYVGKGMLGVGIQILE